MDGDPTSPRRRADAIFLRLLSDRAVRRRAMLDETWLYYRAHGDDCDRAREKRSRREREMSRSRRGEGREIFEGPSGRGELQENWGESEEC